MQDLPHNGMEAKTITYLDQALTATYNGQLVVLSLVIAVIGSYIALDLAGQVSISQGRTRQLLWLIGGSFALGISIWLMHFISILAYRLPIPITYDLLIVLVSMVVAIAGSGAGLFVVSRQSPSWLKLVTGGVYVGLGMLGLYFTAIAAMRLAAVVSYDLKLIVLSSVVAISLSLSGLWLAFHPSAQTHVPKSLRKFGSALLVGVAIDGMHYIAMAAVSFQPSFKLSEEINSGLDKQQLAIAVGFAVLSILILGVLASFFGQRLSAEIARAEALRESEERYQNLYDLAPDIYLTVSGDGTIKSVNQFGADYLGYRKEELIDSSFWHLVYETDRQQVQQQIARIFRDKSITSEIELRQVRKDGSIIWERQRGQLLLKEDGTPIELRLICRDITDGKQAEDDLRQNALHDALTGLPNRALFMDRLRQAVEHVKRQEDYLFAVLFLDLDRFKIINDSLGHLIGDQLLIAIAGRIKACLRPIDMVARLGGDEFTILLAGILEVSDALRIAERIQEELRLPFNLGGQEVFTTASIGITLSVTGYDDPENLLRDADTAMYQAKSQGSAQTEIFNPDMHVRAVTRLQLETDLRNALKDQEFRLQYQPIISLSTGRVVGFEALVRWQHPQQGQTLPSVFIPVAQETGLISQICEWVFREACSQMHSWQLQFPEIPLLVSLNLSDRQLAQPDLINQLSQILQNSSLAASSVRLELTEGAIMNGSTDAVSRLWQLRALGVQLSIDDFGTGYSSLGRLHKFPINGLKIDGSFVSQLGFDAGNLEIVSTIVTLAHRLGVDVTAEGVETAAQLALLRELKCEYGQGYFFSHPLDSEAAETLIMMNPRW